MSDQLALDIGRGAVISECGRYRYELTRIWDHGGPVLEWIMLNPSTADADVDDPTIRRCIGFAKRWGYGGIVVHNLYAYRATDPAVLVNVEDPIGPLNGAYLARAPLALAGDCTIVAWGANPAAVGWWNGYPYNITGALNRRRMFFCLGTNDNGSPKHPLYVPSSRTPIPWEAP